MDYLYPSYMAMTESKLNRHLVKRKFPDDLRHKIVELVTKQRHHRANEKRKRGQLTPLWEHLMLPLAGEIRNTHAMLRYTSRNEERNAARVEALTAYLTVITTLYGLLAAHLLFHPLASLVERRASREEADRQLLIDWMARQLAGSLPSAAPRTGPRLERVV